VPIVLVILVGSVLLAGGREVGIDAAACGWTLAAGTLLPLAALWGSVRLAARALASDPAGRATARAIALAERSRRLVPWVAASAVMLATHRYGWLAAIRGAIGDLPALDEAAAISPAVATMVAATWIQWPLEERLRGILRLARVESGLPPVPDLGRARATLEWVRGGGITLVLVPVLMVTAAGESADRLLTPRVGVDLAAIGSLSASVAALLVSPLALRWALGLTPLPPGPVRDELAAACAAHRIRLAGAFLWSTGGTVANAAVLGILPRFRYLLLSDLLLAGLSREEVLAVVEHELAHVKRRHLPWLALAVASIAVLAATAAEAALRGAGDGGGLATGIATAAAFLVFGWISRRFERQADAFAAAELSRRAGSPVVDFAAVEAANSALDRVAELAHVDPRRHSWRHGSIRRRQANLKAIAGLPLGRLPIDRTVARIKLATLAAALAAAWLLARVPFGPGYDAVALEEEPSACAS
jgi:STE24 endopeptidase